MAATETSAKVDCRSAPRRRQDALERRPSSGSRTCAIAPAKASIRANNKWPIAFGGSVRRCIPRRTTCGRKTAVSLVIRTWRVRPSNELPSYVSSADLKTTVRDVENLARRQPALFFGGAFLLGLAAGRFLRSSAGRSEADEGFASPSTRSRVAATAHCNWPKPPRPISVPSAETEGVFDADFGAGARSSQPLPNSDPAGVRGRRPT